MLPTDVAEHLSLPAMAFVGTRDAEHVPQVHRAYAWKLDAAQTHVRFLVPEDFSKGFDEAMADNAQAALTITQPATAKTYQLKGKIVATEPASDEDLERLDEYGDRVFALLGQLYGQDMSRYKAMLDVPHCAAVLEIREAFDQTPGPNAGAAIAVGAIAVGDEK